jgi:hypothetical protein
MASERKRRPGEGGADDWSHRPDPYPKGPQTARNGGRAARDKGARFEREVVELAREHGLKAQRVPLSGATSYAKDDVEITPTFSPDRPWRGECKRRKTLPEWLAHALDDCDFVALRADRHDAVAIIPLRILMELLQ